MRKDNQNIQLILNACRAGNRAGQKKLYQLFFSYGMSVALRYSGNRVEAEEILNTSFFKVFKKIDQYDSDYEFKKWFRQILINTSIDYHRKFKKFETYSLPESDLIKAEVTNGLENLLYEDLLKIIQKLPPSYRLVFNLHAIDGFKHHEIADQLNINVGTSKSNFFKARKLLQAYIKRDGRVKIYGYGE